ncbi:MAG TPA: EAL domain-containing protein, partial [Alicycliphilus sp.]|nr:EAL domain-containing protein [Alicycliphilus sp.]
RQGLLAVVGLALLVLLPALWWLRRRVRLLLARPLWRLTQAVDELGQGRDPAPMRLARTDELGKLATAFDSMAADLAQQRRWQLAHAQALQTEVDERRHLMQRLQQERARLLSLLGAMHQGILFVDTDQRVSYCNARWRALWAMPQDMTIVGLPMAQVLAEVRSALANVERLDDYLRQSQADAPPAHPLELALRDGRTLLLVQHLVHDAQGASMGQLWVCDDVTQQRQTAEQLVTLAERDALTGLYNRRRFEQGLERFFREAARHEQQAAVLFFDLDEFKYVNDRFGHATGDMVLLRVAAVVKALVRETDMLSRVGGDEFAIFMPQASLHSAQLLAERVVQAVAQTALSIEGQTLRLTSSLGIAHYPEHAGSAQELVAHADAAMYQAKHLGKNRWSVYHPGRDMAQAMVTRMAWNERIERALAAGLLRLHFQGVYHAQSGQLAHLEALVRMVDEDDPTRLIAPGQFIGHAEKSGKILDIDRWVLRESIRLLAAHPQLPGMALNISGRSLDDPQLPGFIVDQLAAHGVAPERLLVELTETAAISDLGDAQRFIDALQRSGCTLCLDDFGTGFASFAYLKHLQARVLKIDGLFVRNLPCERENQLFVRSIIEVAHGMGKLTVAEFVEDEHTLELLQGMGVDMVQGYYLDKPRAGHPALSGGSA